MQHHCMFGLVIKLRHNLRGIDRRLAMVMLALGAVWFSGQAGAVTLIRTETVNDSPIAISSPPTMPLPLASQHVSGDRTVYSLGEFSLTCSGERFWTYKFGGTALPFDCSSPPAVELFSPVISGHIAVNKKRFSNSSDPEALYIKDLDSTSAPIRITAAMHHSIFPSIGANTVAWIDGSALTSSSPYGYQPLLYDLTAQLTTALELLESGYNYGMTSVAESGEGYE